jgi:putative transposase
MRMLMAAPDFAMTGGDLVPAVESFGLLGSLPGEVLAAARAWERHVVDVERHDDVSGNDTECQRNRHDIVSAPTGNVSSAEGAARSADPPVAGL